MKKLLILLLVAGCTSYRFPTSYKRKAPTSSNPRTGSATFLPINNKEFESYSYPEFRGYPDSKVIAYKMPRDTVVSEFFEQELIRFKDILIGSNHEFYPGTTIWVDKNKLMEEVEVTNNAWKEFMHYNSKKNLNLSPLVSALPRSDYFSNPFFQFYPVVGISYEQVQEYCKWKTEIVNQRNDEFFEKVNLIKEDRFKVIFRLPSEQEWETYAACGLDTKEYPYGVISVNAKVKVNPKAADYLKKKNTLSQSIRQIREDIKAFNGSTVVMFNVQRDEPYFLQPVSPNYVFDLPFNNYGLYNIIGNVSEMVEEKGVSKGGSYLHELQECSIEGKIPYDGPSKNVGFRLICEIVNNRG